MGVASRRQICTPVRRTNSRSQEVPPRRRLLKSPYFLRISGRFSSNDDARTLLRCSLPPEPLASNTLGDIRFETARGDPGRREPATPCLEGSRKACDQGPILTFRALFMPCSPKGLAEMSEWLPVTSPNFTPPSALGRKAAVIDCRLNGHDGSGASAAELKIPSPELRRTHPRNSPQRLIPDLASA